MPYTAVMFVARKPGMSLEAFIDHYENKHVPLVLSILGNDAPVRHSRHYLKRNPADAEAPFVIFGDASNVDYDCITTVEFRDAEHFQKSNEIFHGSKDILKADQDTFADTSKFRVVAVENPRVTVP